MDDLDRYLSPTLITSVLVLLLTWWVVSLWYRNRKLPPGPWGLPILGSYPFIQANHEYYTKLSKIHGDVFSFRSIGGRLFVVLNGAKVIKRILVNRADEFGARPKESNLVAWVSEGLGVAQEEGDSWNEHRRFFLQTSKNFGVGKQEMEDRILDEIRPLLEELKKSGPSKQPDLHFLISFATSSVISHVLFSKKLDKDQTFRKITTALGAFIAGFLGKIHITNGLALDLSMLLLPSMRSFQKGRDGVRKFTDNIVEEQIQTFDPDHQRGYVDAYLQHKKELQEKGKMEQSTFTKKRLQAISMNMFFEGTESTSSTVVSMLLELSKHPKVQRKVQEELDNVVGKERLPSWVDRPNLPYFDATIQELFRVASLFLVTTHYSNYKETTIKGYRIPERSIVLANWGSIHFDPTEFPNPQVFDPNRFLNEKGKRIKKEGPYPFGIGKRSCIGEGLAQMEVFLFISAIMQSFTLSPGDNDHIKLTARD